MKRILCLLVLFVFVATGMIQAQTYQNNYQADYPHYDSGGQLQWVSNRTFTKINNGNKEYFLFAEGVDVNDPNIFGLAAVFYDNNFNVIQNRFVKLTNYLNDPVKPLDVKWLTSDEFIACGYIDQGGQKMAFVGKFDSQAFPIWINTYPDIELLNSIQPVTYSRRTCEYMACGVTQGSIRAVVMGMNSVGTALWYNIHTDPRSDFSAYTDLVELTASGAPTGKFAVIGYANDLVSGSTGILHSTVDHAGASSDYYYDNTITQGGTYYDERVWGVMQVNDNEIVITGNSTVTNVWDDALALLVDISHNPIVSARYDHGNYNEIGEEIVMFQGSLYFGGHFDVQNQVSDVFIYQTDMALNPIVAPHGNRHFFYRDETRIFNLEVNHDADGIVGCGYTADWGMGTGGGVTVEVGPIHPTDPPYIVESYMKYKQQCLDAVPALPVHHMDHLPISVATTLTTIVNTDPDIPDDDISFVGQWIPCPKILVGPRQAGPAITYSSDMSISVYPSPAKDHIIIEGCKSEFTYSIYSVTGALCESGMLKNTYENNVDISSLSPGVYVIHMQNETSKQTVRFVKE